MHQGTPAENHRSAAEMPSISERKSLVSCLEGRYSGFIGWRDRSAPPVSTAALHTLAWGRLPPFGIEISGWLFAGVRRWTDCIRVRCGVHEVAGSAYRRD